MATESFEQKLREQFSNYERTVWIVNCLEGHLQRYYNDLLLCFDRFPQIPNGTENPLTPDFTAVFVGPYEIVGEVKRALGNQQDAIETNFAQLKRYDRQLLLKAAPNGAHIHQTLNHDLMLLVNIKFANKEAKRLCALLETDRKAGGFQRRVSVFAASCDSQEVKVNWVFTWVNSSDRLNDSALPKDRRLSVRHQDNGEAIAVYPEVYARLQAKHHFCNDAPPDVYLAVVLWSRVFPKVVPQESREAWEGWVMERDCQGSVEFDVPIKTLLDYSKKFLGYSLRKAALESVLALLAKAGLAEKRSDASYRIRYHKFRPQHLGEKADESAEEFKLDHVREGIIDALVRGQRPSKIKVARVARARRASSDKNQLPLL